MRLLWLWDAPCIVHCALQLFSLLQLGFDLFHAQGNGPFNIKDRE
jgi:hypothetical protein